MLLSAAAPAAAPATEVAVASETRHFPHVPSPERAPAECERDDFLRVTCRHMARQDRTWPLFRLESQRRNVDGRQSTPHHSLQLHHPSASFVEEKHKEHCSRGGRSVFTPTVRVLEARTNECSILGAGVFCTTTFFFNLRHN